MSESGVTKWIDLNKINIFPQTQRHNYWVSLNIQVEEIESTSDCIYRITTKTIKNSANSKLQSTTKSS